MDNLYGDILSDLGAGLVGGLGIVPGSNIGLECAVFEAVHGSAPDLAGKNKANPTAVIRSAALLVGHLGERDAAARIENAVATALGDPANHTGDLGGKATTKSLTDAIVRLTTTPGGRPRRTSPLSRAGNRSCPPSSLALDGATFDVIRRWRAGELRISRLDGRRRAAACSRAPRRPSRSRLVVLRDRPIARRARHLRLHPEGNRGASPVNATDPTGAEPLPARAQGAGPRAGWPATHPRAVDGPRLQLRSPVAWCTIRRRSTPSSTGGSPRRRPWMRPELDGSAKADDFTSAP
jgi:hypothetical protein